MKARLYLRDVVANLAEAASLACGPRLATKVNPSLPFVPILPGCSTNATPASRLRTLIPLALAAATMTHASDGIVDLDNRFPAVAGYYELFVLLPEGGEPEITFADQSCSGALISERVILTAAHCTSYNYTEDIGIRGYHDEAWVTFDAVATGNDFRCFLADTAAPFHEYLDGDLACDAEVRSEPAPMFHKAAVAGRFADGIPISHGLTHPGFLRPKLRPDGRPRRAAENLQNAPDVGVLILEQPILDILPLPLRAPGELDLVAGLVGTPTVGVGYGVNWGKIVGQLPSAGLGPMTDLGGEAAKRIATLGPVQIVKANALWPRQDVAKGDNTVCFGDSGSPLFLVRDGEVEPIVSGVLSGATNWCQGSKDPYYRIDQPVAADFIDCIVDHQDDVAAACRVCSAEARFGLCEALD